MSRNKFDAYYTPEWCTRALLDNIPYHWIRRRNILEPSAGTGAITKVVKEYSDHDGLVTQYDIDPSLDYGINLQHLDFTCADAVNKVRLPRWDIVIMNPPFKHASVFIDHARLCAPIVCSLLRWTWLEPCGDRAEFLERFPPNKIIVLPRPKFKGTGADQATAAWFIWEEGCTTQTVQIISPTKAVEYGRKKPPKRKEQRRWLSM